MARPRIPKSEQGNTDDNKTVLPKMIAMNRNLMWLPTSVLHAKTAFKKQQIFITWDSIDPTTKQKQTHSFEFAPMKRNPFPIAEHAKLLDILLAMYANKVFKGKERDEGVLHFRMTDVADIAGKKYTDGFRNSLAEAIYRYMRCIAFWNNAYLFNGMRGSLSCTVVEESSLWDTAAGRENYRERIRLHNESPRNNQDQNTWNVVRFHRKITDVLHSRDTRLFLSEIIKSDLKPIPYIIYRYFYAFSDLDYVARSLNQLCQNFGFESRINIFPKWFRLQLDAIGKANLIDDYDWPEDLENWDKAFVRVKCKCFTKQTKIKDLSVERIRDVNNLTNLALLEYYVVMQSKNIISEDTVAILDKIEKMGGQKTFFKVLRDTISENAHKLNIP